MDSSATPSRWDAIIIGGALSGAATAQLLLKRNPRLRVLILERDLQFTRRVGESTVEVSAHFLGRVLGLVDHLNEHHLVKQGLRFWFQNERTQSIEQCSETGPGYNVRFPGYQVDRAVLDEKVLANAVASGATLRRGVKVTDVDLQRGGTQTVRWIDANGQTGADATRWVVDASGVAAFLARKNGWFVPNHEHPIASLWTRWSGVKNWDCPELAARYPDWSRRTKAVRFTATNHLTGYGWWAWWIHLKGGDVSIGVVFDQRITDIPEGPNLAERLRTMLNSHPAGRELLSEAKWTPGDVHFRRNLAYRSTTFSGEGFVLVGDAAAFMDPFYSPGMDWITYSASAAAALVDDCCRGKPAAPRVERHNQKFRNSYSRWFEAVYRDKYYYMADFDLMTLAFRLDLGLYYLGVVGQPFKHGAKALETPSFAAKEARIPGKIMAWYNRRFVQIALDRRKRGVWGANNDRHYFGFRSYELSWTLPYRVGRCLLDWAFLELREGWRTWFRNHAVPAFQPKKSERPTAAAVAEPAPATV